jgi:hypothetical protein
LNYRSDTDHREQQIVSEEGFVKFRLWQEQTRIVRTAECNNQIERFLEEWTSSRNTVGAPSNPYSPEEKVVVEVVAVKL